MEIVFLIGRIILGGFFLMSGINHFKIKEKMVGFARMKNLPSPGFSVVISGLAMILGGLGVLLGVYVEISLWILAVFLFLVSFTMHKFWTITDPTEKMQDMHFFMGNIALMGAILMILLYANAAWPYVVSLY